MRRQELSWQQPTHAIRPRRSERLARRTSCDPPDARSMAKGTQLLDSNSRQLLAATADGDVDGVKRLLTIGADVNATDNVRTSHYTDAALHVTRRRAVAPSLSAIFRMPACSSSLMMCSSVAFSSPPRVVPDSICVLIPPRARKRAISSHPLTPFRRHPLLAGRLGPAPHRSIQRSRGHRRAPDQDGRKGDRPRADQIGEHRPRPRSQL